ncbi:crosslink repair DNA glycosylase YcaQ family protein [Vibrio sp. 99-70-13A1]|uniref:winged helix-turn-helix domain-containing protein n=1 Tax=Vibrio sp. 99-70-13A1 TaxID=2607601 RepID=UPI00149371E5|nr:crosslink repair DNA glycosylase YcaQ family protein [Vibrio sp. 99-70-13A1]NOH95831.1 winged helix-turn-helix domain-containing protein [Vibrio sp. 99-70-13A1]
MDALSPSQAKKLVLISQGLPPKKKAQGSAVSHTLTAIEQLGYIQIDTISVIQRAHHHTLWNRNPRYKLSHLDELVEGRKVFEYWSHAAAYLPMRDYRFSLYRKNAFKTGALSHWYKPNHDLMKSVIQRIESEGPLMAKDFEGERKHKGGWGGKPAKQALETLFMQGDLMVSSRSNFHKVYDLTERVVPVDVDISIPTAEEYARYLIIQYLKANGLGHAAEMSYLLKNTKPLVVKVLSEMLEEGSVLQISVNGFTYFALSESLDLLNQPLARSKLKILSPFDNLLIQRKRMQALFGYDYLLECYVPEAKRQFGYFCLPILWQGELVGRMDCKVDRKIAVLNIHNLVMEGGFAKWGASKQDSFTHALQSELVDFMLFNQAQECVVHKTNLSGINW